MMKRLCVLMMVLALALLPALPAHAVAKTIRVGIPTTGGNMMVPADEAHSALMDDALEDLRKYANWRYTFIEGTEEELLTMLRAGVIDLLGGVYHRPALEERFQYPPYTMGYTYALLVANQANMDIVRDDYASLQGKRIAAVPDQIETERLRSFLALSNINSTIVYTEDYEESLYRLEAGAVDLALLPGDSGAGNRVIARFVVEPYYFLVSPRRADLYTDLTNAYRLLLDTDPSYVDHLYERHFATAQSTQMTLTAEEEAYVARQSLPMRVAVAEGFPPLQTFDENGTPMGISVDILDILAQRTGLEMDILRAEDWPTAIQMVVRGEADAVIGLSAEDTNAIDGDLIMTRSYLEIPRVVVSSKYVEYPSQGLTLALVPGMEHLIDSFTGDVIYADTYDACVALVNAGQADYAYSNAYYAEYSTQQRTYHNVQMLTLPGKTDQIGIGLRRPVEPSLLSLLNKAITSLDSAEVQDIALRNTTLRDSSTSLLAFIYAFPLLVVGVLAAFIGILIIAGAVFVALRTRHSQALYRTQYTDELTGSLNLAGFRREAGRILQGGGPKILSYASIRSFQYVNDHYGYETGDEVLRRVAQVYRADMREGEIFCRAGGATFIALRSFEGQQAMEARMGTFTAQVAEITPRGDPSYHIRLNSGIYIGELGKDGDVMHMVDRANAARQQIKNSAKEHYLIYTDDMYDRIMYAQEIESRMEAALEEGQFVVYIQPKYSISAMKPCGGEALVRWLDNGRLIPPGDFIPQFERNGFIAQLDRYVFEQCCITLRRWMDLGMPVVPISINVSQVQLYSPDFVDSYVAVKQAYFIPDGMLELEFTESILFEDVERLIAIVGRLHNNGFHCSIDDFGKGYSSLTMIKNIPVDTLKLDAQFFEEGVDKRRDTVIIESVVDIARQLGMTSIAEGIERREQITLLQMIGCDMVQGFLFSRPLEIRAFEQYLREKLIEGRDPFEPLGGGGDA